MGFFCITLLCYILTINAEIAMNGVNHLKLRLDLNKLNLRNPKEKWIEQPLNQYDPQETRTFQMRYLEDLDYFKPNGPLYVFLGGEGGIGGGFMASDEVFLIDQLAKETNGAIFFTEHRYYGKSKPDIPKDDKVKYFKYLSSKQALADIAMLIMKLKSDPKFANSPVVAMGGSYSGNLAAWMRALYPDVVDAAIASSAPVLAKKDFHEYLDTVRYAFGKYGTPNCLQNIEKKFKRFENLLKSSTGIETLKEELGICPENDLNVLENKQCLFDHLYNHLRETAQSGPPSSVEYTCKEFESDKKLKLDQLSIFNHTKLKHNDCLNVENCWVDPNQDQDIVAWIYQCCTEFGYFQTTSSEKQPFVNWNPLEFWFKYCKGLVEGDIEKRIDEGVAMTNKMYGGLSPKVSKVVFTHGDMDPWHTLGVLQDLGPDAPVVMVNGTAHCGILLVQSGEPKEMKEKRKYVKELVKKWISNK